MGRRSVTAAILRQSCRLQPVVRRTCRLQHIHNVKLVQLHDTLHKPKSASQELHTPTLREVETKARGKAAERAAKIAKLSKFWSEEPARVMKGVRGRQYAQRLETALRLKQQNAADLVYSTEK